MFSVVAMKSRAFSSVPCSAPEQACRSCEGAQPGSQPRLAEGNVLYHGCQAQFMNGGWPGGRNPLFLWVSTILFSRSLNFSMSLVIFSGVPQNLQNLQVPCSAITAQGLATQLAVGQ